MKARSIKILASAMCLALLATSALNVRAAASEYMLNPASHPKLPLLAPEQGFNYSGDAYVYGDKMFYTTYRTNPGADENTNPTVTMQIFQANADGSGAEKIATEDLFGEDGKIALVTENYILIYYGYATYENAIMYDRRSGDITAAESYYTIGRTQKEYSSEKIPIKHVKEYYLMMKQHSDVSPQRIIVFNGKNAKSATVTGKGTDARILGKTIYYIAEKKNGFYLGSCDYKGGNNKILTKLDAPANCAYLGFKSLNKKGMSYRVMTEKGEKTYKYSFED